MSELSKSEIVPELSQKNLKIDLIHFKEDILRDVRLIKLSLTEKYSILEEKLKEKINKFDLTIKSFEQKILELSKLITTDKAIKEKVEALNLFKEESNDSIFKQRAKLNEFDNRMTKEINRINDILVDSVLYTGIIGGNCKFKTFHDFMDFVLKEISEFNILKDKKGMDLQPFKKKIEQTIDSFRLQINNIYTKEMINNAINRSEENFQNSLKLVDEKIRNIKVENFSTNRNYSNKIEELNSKINTLQKSQNNNGYNSEISLIKKEINKIYEILRDVFSAPEIKKEIGKKKEVYSGVRQYINGVLNANQLSSMKNFSYAKSNSNNCEVSEKHNSAKITPFPSPERIKHKNSFERKKLFINEDCYNNSEKVLDNHLLNSNKIKNSKDNIFISQNEYLFNKNNSNEINENNNMENLINKNIENENRKNDMINSENNIYRNLNLDNNIKKIYKEEEPIITNDNNYEKPSPNHKKGKRDKLNHIIISEDTDENVLSDNTNFMKEKINRIKNNHLFDNFPYNKNISLDNLKKNVVNNSPNKNNNINNNKNENNDKFKAINTYKPNNNVYNQNKGNLNSLKLLKEKEYNQSVPKLEIRKEIKNDTKFLKKENVGKQSNISHFVSPTHLLANKTFTSFPHLQKEKAKEKNPIKNTVFQKNKLFNIINFDNSFVQNDENVQNNQYYYKKKPKKVLLVNPDSITDFVFKKNTKSANRNKNSRLNNGFRMQTNIDKLANEMIKGCFTKKINKLTTSGNSTKRYNSLYDIITTHEITYGKKKKSKINK